MDYKELLERFWEGQTTLEEERALREHLSKGDAGTPESAIFGAFALAAAVEPRVDTAAFSARMKHKSQRRRWTIAAAAAMVLIMATAVLTQPRTPVYAYVNGTPVTDYDTAYAYTQGALALLNDNLNESMKYLDPIIKE